MSSEKDKWIKISLPLDVCKDVDTLFQVLFGINTLVQDNSPAEIIRTRLIDYCGSERTANRIIKSARELARIISRNVKWPGHTS